MSSRSGTVTLMSELKMLRVGNKIPAADIINVLQRFYPGIDKPLLSKLERPQKYGITLKPDAMDALVESFLSVDAKSAYKYRKNGSHRLTCRISCRLESDDYDALQQLVQADGYATMQEWLTQTVRHIIHEKRKEHPND